MKTLIEITQENWGAAMLVFLGVMFFVALTAILVMDWRWRMKTERGRARRNAKIYRRAAKAGVL